MERLHRRRLDLLLMALLAGAAGVSVYALQHVIDPVIYDIGTIDAWFDSDVPTIFQNLTDRRSDFARANVHPLFPLVTYPPVQLLLALGLEPVTAVRLFVTAAAMLWTGLLYLMLRLLTGRPLDAALYTLVAAVSAAAFFFLTVPETYVFSSMTLTLALIFVLLFERGAARREGWAVAASTATLSMLLTNWAAGLLIVGTHFPWKRALQISVNALVIVLILWAGQRLIFPTTGFFLSNFEYEGRYLLEDRSGGPLAVVRSFFLHTAAMPEPEQAVRHQGLPPFPTLMLTQPARVGSGGPWGLAATALWVGLLALGLFGPWRMPGSRRLRLVILLLLLGFLALHLLYGTETFLYSLNYLPVLIATAALGSLTRLRPVALALAALFLVSAGVNNYHQFRQAAAFFDMPLLVTDARATSLPIPGEEAPSGRERALAAMLERPGDPWPRGEGHVVLALPGSPEVAKGYLEPGGSFSPTAGSFGLSFWVLDATGELLATGDDLLPATFAQRFVWPAGADRPGIHTATPYYEATWLPLAPGVWQLDVTPAAGFSGRVALALRSVGPAGGPVNRLEWSDGRLLVNDRWRITPAPAPDDVRLGREGEPGWMTAPANDASWAGDDGWGYARLTLPPDVSSRVIVSGPADYVVADAHVPRSSRQLNLHVPDDRFTDSLDAQAAHLLMGLVGDETRPAEPINYPLTWQREAAYIIVALTRAGQTERALNLAGYLAEQDYFGGFGAEADAPGLAIWTLTELARHLGDPVFERSLWPYVARKAGQIMEMLAAELPVYREFSGPVIPPLAGNPVASLAADPARDGLIVGRMDHHRPLLYVNAVSYRGLRDAAALARRLGHAAEAAAWSEAADALQAAYGVAFDSPEALNERTYISGLWPTWVVEPALRNAYLGNLEQRRQAWRTPDGGFVVWPLWTYFDVAEAHQWLYLDRPDRAWETMSWFWDNQAAPGLYSWWEGSGEENSFLQWEKVRGWVEPPYVSPHYWSAAEMLLLQLDMLAYSRPAGELVIGAGVPAHWLDQPLRVGPLLTPTGTVAWEWDGKALTVTLTGEPVEVIAGPAFAGAPLFVEAPPDPAP